MLSLSEVI